MPVGCKQQSNIIAQLGIFVSLKGASEANGALQQPACQLPAPSHSHMCSLQLSTCALPPQQHQNVLLSPRVGLAEQVFWGWWCRALVCIGLASSRVQLGKVCQSRHLLAPTPALCSLGCQINLRLSCSPALCSLARRSPHEGKLSQEATLSGEASLTTTCLTAEQTVQAACFGHMCGSSC